MTGKNKLEGIKAVVFDAYGTLFDVHAPVGQVAGKLGDKAQSVSDMWRLKHLSYSWLRALMDEYVPFWQVTGESLDYALEAHGINDPALRDELLNLYLTLDAYGDATVALAGLKEMGKATAILSNGSPEMLEAACVHSGLAKHLDHVLSVAEVGIYKPDARVYQMVPDHMNVEPDEVCFVSSNTWDAQAAAHFGFQAARIDRFGLPDEKIPGKPSLMLASLDELLDVVS
jgi:2-haloacid dehalogenase